MSNIRLEKHFIQGALDFETGVFRENPLEFELCYDGMRYHEGIVFYIAGFGDPPGYSAKLLRHIVEIYGYAAVAVKYHCYRSRLETGASIGFADRTMKMLHEIGEIIGLNVEEALGSTPLSEILTLLNPHIDGRLELYAQLIPPGDEYQNFGIMQALDHLYVAEHLESSGLRADFGNIILLGTSHGGYISFMINKISPGFASMIVDNSSYTSPPINYIWDVNSETGYRGSECFIDFGKIRLNMNCLTLWRHSGDKSDPCFYGEEAQQIRDLAYAPHYEAAAAYIDRPIQVFSWNLREGDHFSPAEKKLLQRDVLRRHGYDYNLKLVEQTDIDGKVFKTMRHGFDASLRGLFRLAHERKSSFSSPSGYPKPDIVRYDCGEKQYLFERTGRRDFPIMLTLA